MDFKWYIVNVVSGQENKIAAEINRIAAANDDIKEAFIPVKKAVKYVRGKKVDDLQKLFPSYVFVNANLNPSSKEVIRGIPKVLGFLGTKTKPEVVPEEKIKKLMEKVEEKIEDDKVFEIGENVKITEGPFESFTGSVESKDEEKKMLKISVSIFGRPTLVDIGFAKVEKL